MGQKSKLSKKQLEVLEELFSGEDEQSVLERHKVSRKLYNKWLEKGDFSAEFDRMIDSAYRQSRALIARYSSVAAAKLLELTESDTAETARKACLDIINLPKNDGGGNFFEENAGKDNCFSEKELSPELGGRMLSILAESDKKV